MLGPRRITVAGFSWCLAAALTAAIVGAPAAYATSDSVARDATRPAADCPVIDLMPEFWQAVLNGAGDGGGTGGGTGGDGSGSGTGGGGNTRGGGLAAGLAAFAQAHRDVYNPDFVALPTGAEWERLVAEERAYVSAHRQEVDDAGAFLAREAPRLMRAFGDTFPDFRCDFPFYIAPSFGRMDGTAVFVAGQHRIIFAPDVIPRYHALSELRVLIDHETFHIYHHQATGLYGAFDTLVPSVLEALWSEGLATYVSWRMNPDVSLDVALLLPGIPEGARPHLASIARELLAHLDEPGTDTFGRYFVGGRQPAGYPPRAGYYVGVLVAQALAERYPLADLAHLKGTVLRDAVVHQLEALAASASRSGPRRMVRYRTEGARKKS